MTFYFIATRNEYHTVMTIIFLLCVSPIDLLTKPQPVFHSSRISWNVLL